MFADKALQVVPLGMPMPWTAILCVEFYCFELIDLGLYSKFALTLVSFNKQDSSEFAHHSEMILERRAQLDVRLL